MVSLENFRSLVLIFNTQLRKPRLKLQFWISSQEYFLFQQLPLDRSKINITSYINVKMTILKSRLDDSIKTDYEYL